MKKKLRRILLAPMVITTQLLSPAMDEDVSHAFLELASEGF